jgi:ketosteroid isomerase-like protein
MYLRALSAHSGEFMQRLPFSGSLLRNSRSAARFASAVAMLLILFSSMTLLAAQKNNKKDAKDAKSQDPSTISSLVPSSDSQAIEFMVSQMLAAWQIGDDQMLHMFYADDVLVVSGAWEPPLQGWPSYQRAYLAQRARTQGSRLERTNTFTKVVGTVAWCTYQWEFSGQVDNAPAYAVGQTTLLLEKRAGKWLIVANHTSAAPTPQRPAPVSKAPATQFLQPTPVNSSR